MDTVNAGNAWDAGRRRALHAAFLLALAAAACRTTTGAATPTAPPASAPGAAATSTTTATATATPTATLPATSTATPIPLPSNAQLSAPSHNVVWALVAGHALFRSVDTGDSWEERPLPPDDNPIGGISFVGSSEGWALVAGSPATQCQVQQATIWHTADAGASWQALPATGIGGAQCKGPLAFVDQERGFLVGWSQNQAPVIYRSLDGGVSWSASGPLPDPPGEQTRAGGFALRPQRVQRAGGALFVAASGWQHTYVYRSTDGGANWTYRATVPDAVDLGSVSFITEDRWWASGSQPGQTETEDGGVTWHRAPGNLQFAAPIPPVVVFADADVGYATVRGVIRRTRDGGAHWTDLRTPGTAVR